MGLLSKKNKEVLAGPLSMNNPVIVQMLGICSALAVTSKLEPAIVMGISVTVVVAFANVGAEFGQGGYGRTSAMAMAMVMLCHTARTQFGLGPMVLVNTNSKVPAFLVCMYRHRFSERWAINLYGGMFGIDYTPTRDDLIAIGGDIDVKSFFLCPQTEGLPGRCVYRKTAFRPMVKYRRRLRTHLYVEAMAGVSLSMSSRVTGLTGTTEYMDISQKPAPFAQIGVSYAL